MIIYAKPVIRYQQIRPNNTALYLFMPNTSTVSLFILLLLAFHSQAQLCPLPGINSNDLLQTGTALISNTYVNTPVKREHLFTFTLNFNAPAGINVAASASSFQVTALNGMDFSIWGGQGTSATTGMIILLINQDNSWSSISVSYLASGRSDFFLGSFLAGLYFLQKQSQSSVIVWNQAVTGWVSSQSAFTVIVELAGLKTYSTSPVISLTNVNFNSTSGTISTTISLSASPLIQSAVITYIIVDKASPISYYPFSVSSGSNVPYQFFGMDQLQSGNSVISGNGFSSTVANGLTCVGSGCQTSCISSQQCITYFGILTATNCFICASGQIVTNGQCVTPSSPCSTNQYYNGTTCLCNLGYIMVSSACYVSCGVNAYVLNSQCQCIPGYAFSNSANQCVQSTVICGSNFVLINNQCVCPTGMVVDNFTNNCTYCNAVGRVISNGKCICSPAYYPTNTTCIACIPYSTYNPTTLSCVCNQNYMLVNGQCQVAVNCPANSYYNTNTRQCMCNTSGQYIINGTCQACQQYSSWNGSSCVCQNGYILNGGLCVLNCSANSYWNGSGCVCNAGYYIIAGICQLCDVNSYYSTAQSTCVCNNGYFGTWNNCSKCDSSCVTCNGSASSQCLTCPSNTIYVNGTCSSTCAAGTYLSSAFQCLPCDSSCATCSGAGSKLCTSCSSGLTLQNGSCVPTSTPTTITSKISLRGYVLGNQVIYQGVSMNLMPTGILSGGCSICNNLFLVTVNSQFAAITVTQQFLTNTQYWFIVTFAFPAASTIPTFEFSIKINPTYANYFTSLDMAQLLTGSFTQSMFNSALATSRTSTNLISTPILGANLLNPTALRYSNGIDSKTIQQIFGSNTRN